MFWYVSLILKISWPLSLQTFLLSHSSLSSSWDSNDTYSRLYDIVPQLWWGYVTAFFLLSLSLLFFLSFSLHNFFRPIFNSIFLWLCQITNVSSHQSLGSLPICYYSFSFHLFHVRVFFFFWLFLLFFKIMLYGQCGAWNHDPKIKSCIP